MTALDRFALDTGATIPAPKSETHLRWYEGGGFGLKHLGDITKLNGAENCRWASEIEQFPIAVVKRHFGDEDAGIVGDVDKFLKGETVC